MKPVKIILVVVFCLSVLLNIGNWNYINKVKDDMKKYIKYECQHCKAISDSFEYKSGTTQRKNADTLCDKYLKLKGDALMDAQHDLSLEDYWDEQHKEAGL